VGDAWRLPSEIIAARRGLLHSDVVGRRHRTISQTGKAEGNTGFGAPGLNDPRSPFPMIGRR